MSCTPTVLMSLPKAYRKRAYAFTMPIRTPVIGCSARNLNLCTACAQSNMSHGIIRH